MKVLLIDDNKDDQVLLLCHAAVKQLQVRYVIAPNRFESLIRLIKRELALVFGGPKEQIVIKKIC